MTRCTDVPSHGQPLPMGTQVRVPSESLPSPALSLPLISCSPRQMSYLIKAQKTQQCILKIMLKEKMIEQNFEAHLIAKLLFKDLPQSTNTPKHIMLFNHTITFFTLGNI